MYSLEFYFVPHWWCNMHMGHGLFSLMYFICFTDAANTYLYGIFCMRALIAFITAS